MAQVEKFQPYIIVNILFILGAAYGDCHVIIPLVDTHIVPFNDTIMLAYYAIYLRF